MRRSIFQVPDKKKFDKRISQKLAKTDKSASEIPQSNLLEKSLSEDAARARRQSVVASLGQTALSGKDFDALLKEIVRQVADTLDVKFSKILEFTPDKKNLRLRAGIGWQKGMVGSATVGAGLDSQAGYTLSIGAKEPVIVEDLSNEKRFAGPSLLSDHRIVSGMSVIIGDPEEPFGILGAHSTRKKIFDSNDAQFLLSVANIAAAAAEREETAKNQKLVFDLAEKIRRAKSPGDLMRQVSNIVSKKFGVSRCGFNEVDHENKRLVFHSDFHFDNTEPVFKSIELSEISQQAIAETSAGLTVVNNDTKTDKRTASLYDSYYKPQNIKSYIVVPLLREEVWKASLVVLDDKPRHWSENEIELLETVAERVWLAVEKLRSEAKLRLAHKELEQRVQDRTRELAEINKKLKKENEQRRFNEKERVRLIKELITTQEEERRRIARDIHDHLGQQLTVLRLNLKSLKSSFGNEKAFTEKMKETEQIAKQIDSDVSFIARQLRPSILDDLGLSDALINYVEEWSGHFGIKTKIHTKTSQEYDLSSEVETNLYRIAQEILNNTIKHSEADRVSVLLEKTNGEIVLIVEDNGKGFDPEKILKRKKTLGLTGIRERAALVGGTVEIESAPDTGTTVFVNIPVTPRCKTKNKR